MQVAAGTNPGYSYHGPCRWVEGKLRDFLSICAGNGHELHLFLQSCCFRKRNPLTPALLAWWPWESAGSSGNCFIV